MTTKKTKARKAARAKTSKKGRVKALKDDKLWAFAHLGTVSGWEGPINLLPLRYHSGMTLEEVKVAHKKAYLEGCGNEIECATEEAEEIQGAWVVEKSLWKVLDRTIGIASSDTGAAIEKNNAKIVLNESAVKVIGRTIAECEAEEAAREEEKRKDKEERRQIMETLEGYSTAELKALVTQTKKLRQRS